MSAPLPASTPSAPFPDGERRRPAGVVILNWRDTTNPEGGGSELYVEQVAAGLAAGGRRVTLVCAAHPGAPAEEVAGGVRVLRRGSKRTVYLRALLLHAAGRFGEHQAVIDVHNGVPFLSALWCRRPVVVLVHHVHREQWGVVLPRPLARLGWWLESAVAPRAYRRARYVTVSESTRRELAGLGVREEAITVIHNGAGPLPAAFAAPRAAVPTVCVLGRLVPHKRVELALEAVARIRRLLPSLRMDVVGRGWWEPRLRETAERLGLGEAVRFHGFVGEVAKRELLASAWVLAMPSIKEGWGLAVMEAAAQGTPAVGLRSAGGLAESIVDGETGLLADGPEEFDAQLERVLSEEPLRRSLGEAARLRCGSFTWERTVAAFAAVLDAAVGDGNGQRPP
jgi:glycosyltransferase involved in cell wall biosynthesis